MLPQRYRLRRRADVRRVRQQGRAWRHPLAVLLIAPAAETAEVGGHVSRFAFTASRTVGTAVRRNRAKRLLREAVRANLPQVAPGWDCVIIARSSTPDASYAAVCAAIQSLFRRASLIPAAGQEPRPEVP